MRLTNRYIEFITGFILSLLLVAIYIWVSFNQEDIRYLFYYSCLICSAMVVKSLNYIPNFLVTIFMALYTYFMYTYFVLDIPYTYRPYFDLPEYQEEVLLIYSLFFLTLFLVLKRYPNPADISKSIHITSSPVRFWVSIAIILLITILSKSGDNMLDAGSYGAANKLRVLETEEAGFNLFEYVIVFMPIAFKFSDSLTKRIILIMVSLFFCMKGLVYGGRIEVIQVLSMLMFLFFISYLNRHQLLVVIGIIGGIYLTMLFGKLRNDPLLLGTNDWGAFFNVFDTNSVIYYSHHGDVFYASARVVGMVKEGIIDFETRVLSLATFIGRLFIPVKYLPDYSDLSSYLGKYYSTGGGGFIGAFFYAWLSYPGVIFIGLIVGKLMNAVQKKGLSEYQAIILLVFLSTFPRWVAYYPINMFKMCLYSLIIYLAFNIGDLKISLKLTENK